MTNFTRKPTLTHLAVVPLRLAAYDRPTLLDHFQALDTEDRRLRFGNPLGDSALRAYVERIDFDGDDVIAVRDERLRIVGAIHVARAGEAAELGLSVLPGYPTSASAPRSSSGPSSACAIEASRASTSIASPRTPR